MNIVTPIGRERQVQELLADLATADIRLSLHPGRAELDYDAPSGAFTDALKARVRALKPELLATLQAAVGDSDVAAVFPAHPAIEGQWLARRDRPADTLYNITTGIPLPEGTRLEDLRPVLERAVARHDSLRSSFVEVDGELMQRVHVNVLPELSEGDDLRAVSREPFDPRSGPLIRFRLAPPRGRRTRPHLIIVADHLCFDGQSIALLGKEIEAEIGGGPPLPPPPSAAELAAKARRELEEARGEAAQAFWRQRMPLLQSVGLPDDPDAVSSGGGRRLLLELDTAGIEALGQVAALGRRATQAAAWIALTILLIARMKENGTAVVGLPFAGRRDRESQRAIGCFANVLPIAIRPDMNQGFGALLNRVTREILSVMDVQDYPLSRLHRDRMSWAADDQPGRTEPFDAVGLIETSTISLDDLDVDLGAGKFPLMVGLYLVGERKLLAVEYQGERYGEIWARRFGERFLSMMRALAQAPDTPLGRIDLTLPDERALLASVNDTATDYPRDLGLGALFARIAADPAHAGRVALSDTSQELTYPALAVRAGAVAAFLSAQGIAPGAVVGLAAARGIDAVTAILGIAWHGSAYLPVDRSLPPKTVLALMRACGATALLADADGLERLGEIAGEVALHPLAIDPVDTPPAAAEQDGESCAYVMFTSGSTGTPKGVRVPNRAVARLVLNNPAVPFAPGETMAQAASLGFDAATLEIWGPLLNGGQVHVIEEDSLFDPRSLGAALTENGVDLMWLTAGLFNRIADEAPGVFAPLRRLLVGGETLSPAHLRKVMAACPKLRLLNGYGPTENTTFTTTHPITAADVAGGNIPIGRPIGNTRCHILDRRGMPVPIGTWGELYAAGDGLALGYAGQREMTDAVFLSVEDFPEARLYRTGDRTRWRADGTIQFGGRIDGQVKIRGHRIETAAVEGRLGELAGVRDVCVLAVGKGADAFLGAAVAADADSRDAWAAALSAELPDYMVPERFVVVDHLPVNVSGKADRKAIANLLQSTAPSGRRASEPAGQYEAFVVGQFRQLLGREEIGPASDFFGLGGHSLLAMRLAGLIEAETGVRPKLQELFAARTVSGIAGLIEARRGESPSAGLLPRAKGPDFPLSSGQARLWVLQRLQPDLAVYSVPATLQVAGAIDPEALQRALYRLEDRQHALRLRFRAAPGHPDGVVQHLAPAGGWRLGRHRMTEEEARRFVAAESARPFALADQPLVRAEIIELAPDRHWLLLSLHHAICDGWSMPTLLRDLAACYAVETGAPAPALPQLLRQYEDFASWQRGWLQGPDGEAMLERWKARLTPLPDPLNLPTDRRRPAERRFNGAFLDMTFDDETATTIDWLARERGVTAFAVLTALVQFAMHRLCGQTDIPLGMLVAGREQGALDDLIGFFVNTVVLRQTVDPQTGFGDHLAATARTVMEALSDQAAPFEEVVKAVRAPRDPSRNPLFDVLVAWQEGVPNLGRLGDAALSLVPTDFPFSKFDLAFYFWRKDGALGGQIEYDTDLFDRATVAALVERLALVVAAIADVGTEVPLAALPVLTEAERADIARFNATARDLPIEREVCAPFLDQLAATPDAPAVTGEAGTLTYRQFARRAAGVAEKLQAAGVKPGDLVALSVRRSVEMLAGIHGILLAGAAYAPVDPDHPQRRRTDMLEDLGHPVVLTTADLAARYDGLTRVILDGSEDAEVPVPASNPDDLAYVLFTSGSTGRPKGVAIEHRGVLNRILWMQETFPLGPGDVILQKTPITFDVSVWELFWWSWVGARVLLPAPGVERDPQRIAAAVRENRVTAMHFVPSMLASFLYAIEAGQVDAADLASLRYVFASGEALDKPLVARFNALLHARFGTELHNLYGPTEATVDVTWHACSPTDEDPAVPIGRPIANTQVHVLDEALSPLPIGVPGEIVLGGPQIARGYLNRPELSAEKFPADLDRPGGRLYRTGDLGRWRRDGTLEYLGRLDDQVKVRGFRIECGEIEAALERHPKVERALVRAVRVGGLNELHAFILGDEDLAAGQLRDQLRQYVPDYMIPGRFFALDVLPLTSSGKVDRKALKGKPMPHGPARGIPARNTEEQPANALLERQLLELWRELLPEAEAIDRYDGFFDIGGDSLRLLRLHEKIVQRWPGSFTVAELFGHPTIAAQAEKLAGSTETLAPGAAHQAAALDAPIAVIGIGLQLAGSSDLDGFWRDAVAGADRVAPLPASREEEAQELLACLGRTVPARFREAAYLETLYAFDPARFRMAPADAALLDPEQRLFIETALMAVEHAGYGGQALRGQKVGVYAGGGANPVWRLALDRLPSDKAEQIFALNVPSNIATRLSFLKDWRGPAAVIDTACSSSLVAVHQACGDLRAGACTVALAGGAKLLLAPPDAEGRFTIDSSTARTRAFAEGADGTGIGEGGVVFALKRLEDAERDGDSVLAVIRGSAVNQDGASSGAAAPNPAMQAEAIRTAAQNAGIALSSLSYIEAHGTGTGLGDPIEIDGLTRAFAADTAAAEPALIGSAKGNYGHLDGAAGALGLARAILALRHDTAPPQPFFDEPNPKIDFDRAPVRVAERPLPLPSRGVPRRAGVSSFGLSGINAHVIVEAAPPRLSAQETGKPFCVVALSAATEEALIAYAGALRALVSGEPAMPLVDIAYTLATGRDALKHRFAAVAADCAGLLEALEALIAGDRQGCAAPKADSSREAPALAIDGPAAALAARQWLDGATLIWPPEAAARRANLPPAPFARIRCRPPFQFARPAGNGPLGRPVPTPQGLCFAVRVGDPDFWPVAEHVVNGNAALVGMAVPALIALAAGREGSVTISDLKWQSLLIANGLAGRDATLCLGPDGTVELGAQLKNGQWRSYASARCEVDGGAAVLPDLAAIRVRCTVPIAIPSDQAGPIATSDRWGCRISTMRSPDGTTGIAQLRLPQAYRADLASWPLHPAMADIAISSGLSGSDVGMVPIGFERLTLFRPFTAGMTACLQRIADDRFDVALFDESDRPALAITGLSFARYGQDEAPPVLATLWEQRPLPEGPVPANTLMIVDGGHWPAPEGCRALAADQIDAETLAGFETAILALEPGTDVALRLANALRAVLKSMRGRLRLAVIGTGACVLEDDEVAVDPDQTAALGLTLSAAREEPQLIRGFVDVTPDAMPAVIGAELSSDPGADPVALWRDGRRFGRRLEKLETLPEAAVAWPGHGVCVITGGTGGFALALAEEMAAQGAVSLALLARRGEDGLTPAAAGHIGALRAAGARVEAFSCDVGDREALDRILTSIRATMGPITAVVHAAGVADGGFLATRDMDGFAEVMRAKVEGARALDTLTQNDPLEAFVMFGSLTGLGAAGQTAYAAANAFLDGFARQRRDAGRPALTIDWCALSGQGMAARHEVSFRRGAVIAPWQAAGIWRQALRSGLSQVVVVDPALTQGETAQPAPQPSDAPDPSGLAERLAAIWREVLEYDSVDPSDDFFALGGDSITGMQIVERIGRELGFSVSVADLFDHTTLEALTTHLGGKDAAAAPIAPAPIAPAPPTPGKAEAAPVPPADPRRAPEQESYPLAFEQLSVLRASEKGAMGTAFNLPHLVVFDGKPELPRLASAVHQLIERHESLRTRLVRDGDDWRMRIEPVATAFPDLTPVDLPSGADLREAASAFVTPLDVEREIPVRWRLLREPDGRHSLFFDIHHALADGFSTEQILGDLLALYRDATLQPVIYRPRDYAWWSHGDENRERIEAAKRYWTELYAGPLPMLDLPADRRRPAQHSFRGEFTGFLLEPELLSAARSFAARQRISMFTLVLATWFLVLRRLADSEDVTISVPVGARDATGFNETLGMMVSLLPLRLRLAGEETVGELLRRTQAHHAEALRHRAYFLDMLLADLAPPAAPERTLLSEVTLSYMSYAGHEAAASDTIRVAGLARRDCKNDLGIFVRDLPDSLSISFDYYAAIFDRARMEDLGRLFSRALGAVIEAPDAPLRDISLLSAETAERLRTLESGPTPALPEGRDLYGLFLEQATCRADAIAARDDGGAWTFAELRGQANAVAAALAEAGVRRGDLVALHVERGREAIAATLGVSALGAGYVPLDPAYPPARNSFILQDCGARVVLVDAAGQAALSGLAEASTVRILCFAELARSDEDPTAPADPESAPAYVMYTSGSTGEPKGVLIEQRAVLRLALGEDYVHLVPGDVVAQAGPLAFDASTFEIWAALLHGAEVAVIGRDTLLDPAAFAAALRGFGVTKMFMSVGLFNRQVEHDPSSLSGLSVLMIGGDAISKRHARLFLERCPETALMNGYGPTECTTFAVVARIESDDLGEDSDHSVIGRPIAHTRAVVLDADGQRAPFGVWGELLLGGPGLARGYHKRPELTAERFVADPDDPAERLYRTGDLARFRRDGRLEFGGRRDNQIKLRGFRIELEEIDRHLLQAPGVRNAAAIFDAERGEIVGCVTGDTATAEIAADLAAKLPAYMVPARWCRLEMLPINANGKIDRKALLALARSRSAEAVAGESPRTEAERLVADIFAEVFDSPVEDRKASFATLGGHSLMAIQIVNRIEARTGQRISMAAFFADSSVAGIASHLDMTALPSDRTIPPAPAMALYPASHAQRRLYLLSRMENDSGAYGMIYVLRCTGALAPAPLQAALAALVARHEALRTGFVEQEGEILQRVADKVTPAIAFDDLSGHPDPLREALRLTRREAATPVPLDRPPLIRGRIIRVAPNEQLLVLATHHIVGDGWSSRILMRELGALFRAEQVGAPAALAPLPISYKDFAVWQAGRDWGDAADYWRAQLAGAPERIELPADRAVPEAQSYRGGREHLPIPPEVMRGLHALAESQGVVMPALGMALFAAMLYRLTRQGDMVIGMGVSGRERQETEGLIGFFVNVLPIRVAVDTETELTELTRRLHATIAAALDRQDYPFDELVRVVAPRRQANRQPLVNVVFEYQRFESLAGMDDIEGLPLLTPEAPGVLQGALDEFVDNATAKHDAILFLAEEGGEARFTLEYDSDLFDASTIRNWLAFLGKLAAAAAGSAEENRP